MKNIVIALALVLLPTLTLAQAPAPAKPTLSELTQLKVDLFNARASLATCSSQLSTLTLAAEKTKLEAEVNKEINANAKSSADSKPVPAGKPPLK